MAKTLFFVFSIVILLGVIGFVLYQNKQNPEKAAKNQQALEDSFNDVKLIPGDASLSGTESSLSGDMLGSNTKTMNTWNTAPTMSIDVNKTYQATLNTSDGAMTFELYAKEAPLTVNNFVFLANNNFYNDTKFHRIIKDFMVQGGDPKGDGTGGPGYKFNDEAVTRDYVRGTLAMANSGPNTNGSQFFIMTKDSPLPKNYTIFGKLIAGDDVLQKISETLVTVSPMGEESSPLKTVLITNVLVTAK
jgi:cyclophilin family peptidyl-prolyl cis-trans isomerase